MKITDEQFEVIKGVKEGKSWQYMPMTSNGEWADPEGHNLYFILSGNVKVRLKPEPRMVELGPDDILPHHVFRFKTVTHGFRTIDYVSHDGVKFNSCPDFKHWQTLREDYLMSEDGKIWSKCEKEVIESET